MVDGDLAGIPAVSYFAVTPDDDTDFANNARGLYIGGAGNVVAVTLNGDAVTFSAVPVGTILPIFCKRVNATSTTATNIVALR